MSTEEALTSPSTFHSDENPPMIPFPSRGNTGEVILPKWIYIKDRQGRYLTERSGPTYGTITFRSGDPNLDCAFKVVRINSSQNQFFARSGRAIVRYYSDPAWYSADGQPGSTYFSIITSTGNIVYLRDNLSPTRFFSNDLNNFGAPPGNNFLGDSSLMEIIQASIKNEITDIHYDINGAKVRQTDPKVALTTSVRNDSDGPVNQTLTYSYEKWSVGTWNNSVGVEIGAKASFEAGVPFVANAKFEVSISASYSHQWGGETGVRETVTSSTTITVPPKKKARATVVVSNALLDVGFAYTQKVLWSNGDSEEFKKTGIYQNVDSWNVDVELTPWEPV